MEITKYIKAITDELIINQNKLNDLDTAIGDGDHGSNVVRGFKAILEQTNSFTNESLLEKDFMVCAQQLMSKIGGSSGPLLGSAFMALAVAFKGKTQVTNQDIADGLQKAYDRISQLGKSKLGEKTMLDAIYPTIAAMKETTDYLDFSKTWAATKKGADDTIPMLATKGRASYLGERSIGHMDPGACCISIIFEGLVKASTNSVDLGVNITTSTSPQSAKPVEERKYQMLPITRNVSVLVISHSLPLAKATFDFASEMKTGDFAFEYIGGIENGKLFGTNPQEIKERIQKLATDSEVLIIYDLGSSKMNSEMAISLIPEYNSRVQIASCAFVEGVTIAVSSNNTTSASELRKIVETDVHVNK